MGAESAPISFLRQPIKAAFMFQWVIDVILYEKAMETMKTEELDKMLKWSEDLKKEIETVPFDKDDVRYGFFGLLYDVGYNYYLQFMLFDLTYCFGIGEVTFGEAIFAMNVHVKRAMEISAIEKLNQSYYNSLNRNFLISTWSAFEASVTQFCEALASPEEKEKLLAHEYDEVMAILKNSGITPEVETKLKKKLTKKHLTHVPITKKTDFLFKKAQNYSRNEVQDREFLAFLGRFRNTFHTNFIFHGNDCDYQYEDKALFRFKNNEKVGWNDKYNGRPDLYFDIKTTIKEIWKALILNIEHKEIIAAPEEED